MSRLQHSALTPADGMRPNREANTVANVTVKPSVVVVPTCKTTKDNRFTHGCERPADRGVSSRGGIIRRFANRRTPSRTVAWNPESKGTLGSAAFVASMSNTWNTACGDGACDPHRANKFRSGESRLIRKLPTTRTATSARSVLLFNFYATTSRDALTSAASAVKIRALSIGVVNNERGVGCGEPRIYFQPTKPKKESNMMNRIMVSLFAVLLAAFAVSAVMRERVKAEVECRMMEVAR